VTITVICNFWAPYSGDHLFTCGAIYRPPQVVVKTSIVTIKGNTSGQ